MRIAWSQTAIANLVEIREYVGHDKPEAARRLAERIIASVERLAIHPHLGHAGREPETRELVIGGTPYIIPYRIHDGQLAILAVFMVHRTECKSWVLSNPPDFPTKRAGIKGSATLGMGNVAQMMSRLSSGCVCPLRCILYWRKGA